MRALAALAMFVSLASAGYAEQWDIIHEKGINAAKHGDFGAAVDWFRQSLAVAQTDAERAVTQNDLGISLCHAGRPADAKVWLERALATWRKDPARRTLFAQTSGALAVADRSLGDYVSAEGLLRTALEQQDVEGPTRSYLLSALGDMMREEGNFSESRRLLKDAEACQGVSWRERIRIEVGIAELDRDTRNWDASVREWHVAVALAREKGDTSDEAACDRGLGQTWLDQGNASRAEPLLKTAVALFEREPVREEGEIAASLSAMGELYLIQDKSGLAEEVLRRSLMSHERSLGADRPQTALVLELLADAVSRQGKTTLSREYLDRAEAIMFARFGEHSVMAATAFVKRGMLEQRAGNAELAAAQFRKALNILGTGEQDLSGYRQAVLTRYAAVLKAAHHKEEAKAVMAQSGELSFDEVDTEVMPQFEVATPQRTYAAVVERGVIARLREFLTTGKIFVVTTSDVWELHGARLRSALGDRPFETLIFAGSEENKRFSHVEQMAEQMVERGADRSSIVVAFGGGIVTDLAGFLAAIFMRGVPVIQIPTTLLAQVDAAVGGKTGANLTVGKNLIGAFHQPLAVLIDPAVLSTLPEREYRAGLYEIVKTGVIASEPLFRLLADRADAVLAQDATVVDHFVSESVRIKAEVVSADERENGLRKILNFGHTFGHSLEAETGYTRFLHGEAVSWGMRAATYLARDLGMLAEADGQAIFSVLDRYGPIPSLAGISAEALQARLVRDKKTIRSRVHFVLPVRIGEVVVRADVAEAPVLAAIERALADCQ